MAKDRRTRRSRKENMVVKQRRSNNEKKDIEGKEGTQNEINKPSTNIQHIN